MWYNVFKFEIQYRIKRADTYIFFFFLFLFSTVGAEFIFQGIELGILKKNSPIVIAKAMGAITGIFMILASMIMGVSVLRDFEYQIDSLIFSTPVTKKDYLLGRFLGSFTVLLFVFSGILFGMALGEFMPWHKPEDLLAFNFITYLKPFVLVTLPILFFGASLFFISGALSRKLVVVYTQGIIFFVIFMLTKSITNDTIQAILDPFSLTTLSLVTDSWTALEKSTQPIPFISVLLYNKLFWALLGVVILLFGYKKFNYNVVKNRRYKNKSANASSFSVDYDNASVSIPDTKTQHNTSSKWLQLRHFSWFYFINIFKQPSFWAILICGMIIILINSVSLGTVYGVDSYPTTYFIVEELQETSIYFFIIILMFYSGELIWKERDVKLNLIYDATSMSSFINLLSKFIGLNLVYIVLIIALIISGVLFQTLNGYYNYEFHVYFNGFFLEVLPFLTLYTGLSFFLQIVVNHKFIGIILTILLFICIATLGVFGFDHDLFLFGGSALGSYSDMNGYGHFLKPYMFIKTYWFLFVLLLLITASLISVRGKEMKFTKRLKGARYRTSKPFLKLSGSIATIFIILGGFIFYNTNILNTYWTNSEAVDFRVSYEKTLKAYEYLLQPKITDVNLKVELYPIQRHYTAEGYYMLKNETTKPITEIHIQKQIENNTTLEYVTFESKFIVDNTYEVYDYHIYKLDNALQPGESLKMNFKQSFETKGFELGSSNENIIANGTFFDNAHFPTIGYNRKYELTDNEERNAYNLPVRPNKSDRDNLDELVNARSGGDSNGIHFEMILGTDKDQKAVAPGNLLKQWTKNNRNYFHYKMDISMINFYAIVSAQYELKKDTWILKSDSITKPIDLEIYYHKTHVHNLDRMMSSMRASLDYYSTNFSPYQYNQLRIMEFPRYAQFAQSFPGTVPFSESIGFVLDIDDEKDVDMAFYITAHEIAHQWFGMQVEAANVKGRHFILESLSQYAALMVLKNHYSEDKVAQFLEFQKETYKKGQQQEKIEEPSLVDVENQDYVYYAKGAINMYKFQNEIGEDKVNLALKYFIEDWNTIDGKLKTQSDRYATSKDLIDYFKRVTPEDKKHIITELFEN
ncbi:M1 family aminopeptidase [uncultured Psychroserpens sp.]|uniref:ABC transporter permease/M1 family aminopeptidase n=1 Tax=uncultured Psychroserpens sp. TaxID=255436 RepID=UPI002620F5DB|nr:M1 family aminopeptidase [uncultured Psychroserpens sp.]